MKLSLFYKKIIENLFIIIYGKVITTNKKIKNLSITKLDKINNENLSKYNYYLYKLSNGRVFTNCVENVSIISGNHLVKKASFQQINGLLKTNKNVTLNTGTPKLIKSINGSLIILTQGASGHNNYAHWMLDVLPRIKLLLSKMLISEIKNIYVTKLNKFQNQSFSFLGLKSFKIIDPNIFRHVKADQIISVSHPYYFKKTWFYAQSNLPSWIIKFLRNDISKKVKSKKKSYKRIFIDRSDSLQNHSKLINNNEVIKYLKSKRYKCLRLTELNLKDQISIFKNCNTIIAPHGAGLTNIAFCKKNTKVIEIIPQDNKNFLFKRISKINKLKYKSIYLDKIYNNKNGDMHLNLDDLKKYL